jgi:hypothetical protein
VSTRAIEVGRLLVARRPLVVTAAERLVVVSGVVELRLTRTQALRLADLLATAAMWQLDSLSEHIF